ncbi:hypothetical protein B0H16DRAFT_1827542 [Mycena metata]|uniref:Uncharacterized protein n=1 Tax=Mycena metata TaxID=1033252 RepID=A0AAD7GU17_9AGAR|nr:hypothetical protein B0H16DRAFT_1827542 [Mycena metata]
MENSRDTQLLPEAARSMVMALEVLRSLRGPLRNIYLLFGPFGVAFGLGSPSSTLIGKGFPTRSGYLYFLERFSSDARTTALSSESAGVRSVIMRGWASLFDWANAPHTGLFAGFCALQGGSISLIILPKFSKAQTDPPVWCPSS